MNLTRRGLLRAVPASAGVAGPVRRPNVLFIMADQLRYDCLGANGNGIIRTPNLDRLAARGANFTRAYVQSPVCVPSRISFFTGRYPHSHKNRVNYTPYAGPDPMLQKMLQSAGYQTGSVGKLHFHPPTSTHAAGTGFDRVYLDDGVSSTDPFSDYVAWRKAHDPRRGIDHRTLARDVPAGGNPFRSAIGREHTPTAWVGLKSRELIREFASSPRPFFLFSSFFKPHAPYEVPEPYDRLYNDVEIPLPRQVDLDYIRTLPLPVRKMILRFTPQYGIDRRRLQWIYRSYYASVTMVDDEVGRILDELDQTGQARNTLIIFSVDHGDQLLEHGLFGKNVFFEPSVHAPLLASLPGAIRPGICDALTESVDVVPSVLDFCGLPVPERVQGRSFRALVTGGSSNRREFAFGENIMPEVITRPDGSGYGYTPGKGIDGVAHPDVKMVRSPRWKLNYYPGHSGELYDLENDPGEWKNLYSHAGQQGRVRDLKDALLDWMITAGEADQIAPKWLL
ncbi:MAG: sulfatase-like hydrolase/transferase [Acidobacteriia bacterium]|nr:sulfatase-like hydrolase/transferase [Terriglobia bacterium]